MQNEIAALSKASTELAEKTDRELDMLMVKNNLPEKYAEFEKIVNEGYLFKDEFTAWINSEPEENEANMKKLQEYQEKIQEYDKKAIKILLEAWKKLEK